VEEFVCRIIVILLYQNITSTDIVIITKQKLTLESKADRSLKAYKSRRRKKRIFAYPRQARAIG